MKLYLLSLILLISSCQKPTDKEDTVVKLDENTFPKIESVEDLNAEEAKFLLTFNSLFGEKTTKIVSSTLLLKNSNEIKRIHESYNKQMEHLKNHSEQLSQNFYSKMEAKIYANHFNGYYSSLKR